MTQPDDAHARPGWIGHTPGYGTAPSRDRFSKRASTEAVVPPGVAFHIVCLLATGYEFWILSTPAPGFYNFLVGLAVLMGCALVWIARLLLLLRERHDVRWPWAVAPIGGLLALVLVATQAPLQARFALADAELRDVARSVLTAVDPAAAADGLGDLGRVGTYRVHDVEAREEIVYFTFRRAGDFFTGPEGVAYVPARTTAPQQTPDGRTLDHLFGPWHHWTGTLFD